LEQLLCIYNPGTNPFYNLALEEYLLKNYTEDIFMLWQNEPTVVVGKHQNTLAEINLPFLESKNIKVARRLSGGGTVYHDMGNLNFTFIINSPEGKMVDFGKYTSSIIEALNLLGVPAQSNKRYDITIEGKKISGNAEHIFKKRVLHHGTLLFNADLDMLEQSILATSGKYIDNAVQSVRSRVCNILPYLAIKMDIETFSKHLLEFMLLKYPGSKTHNLHENESDSVIKLKEQKYSTWDWIFGYSPKYEVANKFENQHGHLKILLSVKKGIVSGSNMSGNLFDKETLQMINNLLPGQKHDKKEISKHLHSKMVFPVNKRLILDEFVDLLF
jgi:lipoate---protein ligase